MSYWPELKVWLLKDPMKIIRYLVLFICCIIVIVQLYECFSKLDNPPISTHSYYNLNETIEMPAVTICRDPPYKEEELTYISGNDCEHPKYSSCWSHYPYEEVKLSEFFENSTFPEDETFPENLSGLNSLPTNLDITSALNFYMGRCHTIRPNVALKRAGKSTGYVIMLKHHLSRDAIKGKYYENRPGWHLFLHDKRDNFTEIDMKASGRVEYVFADINEEIEIKLQSQHFSNVATKQRSCSTQAGYSDFKCCENRIWHELSKKTNCSGPWMYDTHVSPCSNYKSMMKLLGEYGKYEYMHYNSAYRKGIPKLTQYMDFSQFVRKFILEKFNGNSTTGNLELAQVLNEVDWDWDCMQPCVSRIFTAYIQNRKVFEYPEPFTLIYIYYTTKLLTMIEERPSYDTTQFIADVGGSLGFLLGLSVLGLIGILEHITLFICGGVLKRMQDKSEKRLKANKEDDKDSETTADVATVCKDKY